MRFRPIWDVELCLLGVIFSDAASIVISPQRQIRQYLQLLLLLRVRLSWFLCVYPSDVQLYQAIKDISASHDAHLDLLEARVHRTLPGSP